MGIAKGYQEPGCATRNVTCRMDEETFKEVKALSIRKDESVAQTLRDLIEWGLMEERTKPR